jgi:formate--tetrahydrofolate ligase
VVDISDRALRHIVIGLGGSAHGVPREAAFEITVASEIMSILALSSDLADLRARLARIVVASDEAGQPVTVEQLGAAGAMTALLRDALSPNLLQSSEGSPMLVHTGPFGNISTGCSSVLADAIGLKLADYVVTEAGFGSDLGFEKLCNIKCRTANLRPDAAVIVCTLRGLKAQSGRFDIVPGRELDPELDEEDLAALSEGLTNLEKHIENVTVHFGLPAVVCINRFAGDSDNEAELVRERALSACESSYVWRDGGDGGRKLAEAVVAACSLPSKFGQLYDPSAPVEDKLREIAVRIYGAEGVDITATAQRQIRQLKRWQLDELPVCVAKTPLSLSADAKLTGRPAGFRVTLRELKPAAGAGFLIAYLGDIQTMPGLPSHPAAEDVDVEADGSIRGL